jgi:hypothetical protein
VREAGRIIAVQEQRFKLLTAAGQVLLLTLERRAPLEASDLCRMRDERTPVQVDIQGEPNQKGGVARNVLAAR